MEILDPHQMFSDPGKDASVMYSWERFLSGDGSATNALRDLVNASWQRCQDANVDPTQHAGPHPVSEQDFFLLRERQRELLEVSAPMMASARDFLAETGTMMVLADTNCTILTMEGDTPAKDSAESICLVPGVTWSERFCGTNAIGTALAVGQPVQIHSAEHYCAGIKRWTCSATVIRHPTDGEIIGVLDISGLSQTFSRQSLALVVATANRIESRLTIGEMERRYRLLNHWAQHGASVGNQGAVLFDRRGLPIQINEHAHAAIHAAGGTLEWPTSRRIPELAAGTLRRNLARGTIPSWIQPQWIEPIIERGENLGTLVVIPSPGMRAGTLRPPVRAAQTSGDGAGDGREVDAFAGIITSDPAMQAIIAKARQIARAKASVLLLGETGVGKEEFARGIHASAAAPFVVLNCGGLSRELLASELFGYADGAFTGARKGGMAGKIEAADGGTLFLDEIGEMPLDMQPHLLRVLEQGEVCRLGETTPRKVNFHLIAATHRDLRQEVAAGRFRMDLYYRIAVTSLRIPPLRERKGDIATLAQYFLDHFRAKQGLKPAVLNPAVIHQLECNAWEGNVRELRNVIESAVLVSDGGAVTCADLPAELARAQARPAPPPAHAPESDIPSIAQGERALIQRTVAATAGNLTLAARQLNIAKSTLYAKMQRYGLSRDTIRGVRD
uniref:Sigma-54 dependent transcriptional activator n=1 Tax=mine drainage metagenome TaxID=410659 RepID=E6PKS4_9ZZZZ